MQKVAVVTGGSQGIGLAIVKKFIKEGYQVFNLDLEQGELGHYLHCDMADTAQVAEAIKAVIEQVGKINALICNAGIHVSGTIEQTNESLLDRVLAINVKGAYAAIQHTLPVMKQQHGGAIVLMASDQAIIAKTNSFAYNLSKHALASMAKTTALDYASDNIRVNALCPGTIETPLYHRAIEQYCQLSGADQASVHQDEAGQQPLGRLGQPEEVANFTYFLASEQASFITGSLHSIDGGYTTG